MEPCTLATHPPEYPIHRTFRRDMTGVRDPPPCGAPRARPDIHPGDATPVRSRRHDTAHGLSSTRETARPGFLVGQPAQPPPALPARAPAPHLPRSAATVAHAQVTGTGWHEAPRLSGRGGPAAPGSPESARPPAPPRRAAFRAASEDGKGGRPAETPSRARQGSCRPPPPGGYKRRLSGPASPLLPPPPLPNHSPTSAPRRVHPSSGLCSQLKRGGLAAGAGAQLTRRGRDGGEVGWTCTPAAAGRAPGGRVRS
jgi:hypothetical protein